MLNRITPTEVQLFIKSHWKCQSQIFDAQRM